MAQKKQSSISDRIAYANLETLLRIPIIRRKGIIGISDIMSRRDVKFKPNKNHEYYSTSFGGVKADVIKKKNTDFRKIILYFHLGAFVSGLTDTHREVGEMFLKYSDADTVVVSDYRTAPEFLFPAAHEDAYSTYVSLRENYPNAKIITAGDSSGGNLAIALVLMARDRNVILPDAAVLISPWVDFTRSGESYKRNFNSDPMFGYMATKKDKEFIEMYASKADKKDRYLSPVFSEFDSVPPLLIQICSNEMLYDEAMIIKEKTEKAGGKVQTIIYDNMYHSFQTVSPTAISSRKAWEDTGKFINEI